MIIQNYPSSLVYTGNVQDLIVNSVTGSTNFILFKNDQKIFEETYFPDADGKFVVKLKTLLESLLSIKIPDFALNSFIQDEACADFKVSLNGAVQPVFRAIKGGVDSDVFDASNFFSSNWLTWQPQSKSVAYNDPEWLNYYAQSSSEIKAKGYFADGSTQEIVLKSLQAQKLWSVNANYGRLIGLFQQQPVYVDAWVESASIRTSYVQRYILSNSLRKNGETFLFANTLGGIDSICFTGDMTLKNDIEVNSAYFDEIQIDYENNDQLTVTKNTGHIPTSDYRVWVLDFFASTLKAVNFDKRIRNIVLKDHDIDYSVFQVNSYTFSYQLSRFNKFKNIVRDLEIPPNLEIIDPDQEVFFLAPRLNEFLQVSSLDDLIIPVQNAYNPKWLKLSVHQLKDDIVNYLISIIGSGEQSAGFAELARHSYTSDRAFTADLATNALNASEAQHAISADVANRAVKADLSERAVLADKATLAELANRAYTADYSLDSDKWDGRQFDDYLDQPVRANDPVRHKSLSSPSYVSGATGHGFKINEDGSAEFDSVSIRKELNVVTLNIREITGNGGSIAVTNVAEIASVEEGTDYYGCHINTDDNTIFVPFHVGDFVRCQVWDGKGIKYYTARVRAVSQSIFDLDKASFVGAGRPAAGDKVFQFGSDTDTSRQGLIYMTNSDTGAPYIDVLDGINSSDLTGKTKARLGQLNGITDNVFGNLSGYGLYSLNAFLRGQFWVTGGNAETKEGAQAKADAVKVGNRNILSFSNRLLQKAANMTDYMFGGYDIVLSKRPLEIGKEYTLVVSGKHSGIGAIAIYVDGYQQIVWLGFHNDEGIKTFNFTADEIAPQRSRILFYNVPFGTHDLCTINWAVLYEGRITNPSLDWTPAPEDRISDIELLKSETTTSLQVLDDKIATKVTLNEVTQEVNKIKVGSVNLLNNAIDFRESGWNNGFTDFGGGYIIDNNILYGRKQTLRTRVGSGLSHPTVYLENEVEYTYSAMVYSDGNYESRGNFPLHLQAGINGSNEGLIEFIKWDQELFLNQWKLIYVTFKLVTGGNSVNPYFHFGATNDAFLNVAYFKLEKGNKPTDGSPSESDAQFKINTVTNRVIVAETQINQNAQAIQLKADRSEVVSMIEGIQIGGTNYYSNLYTVLDPYLLEGLVKNADISPNAFYLIGEPTGNGELRISNVINSNGEWTVSGWVRGDQFVQISFVIDICDQGLSDRIYTNNTNDWVYFTHTVNVTNYSQSVYNFVDFSQFNYAYYIFKNIKIEIGNKATDWTPSPRDTAGQINDLTTRVNAAELKITPEAINATVSQQVDTKTANALNDSKVYTNSQVAVLNGQINLKADQTTVDILGTRLSAAEVKITPESINLTVSQQVDRKSLASSWGAGKSLYTDTTFLVAANGTYLYNNDHSGAQPIYERYPRELLQGWGINLPSTSTHGMYYQSDGRHTVSPALGGFYWGTPSRPNAKFIVRMIIAFTAGRIIEFQSNAFGDGSKHTWLTNVEGAGTAEFREYICYVECGNTGLFHGTNYFNFAGGDGVVATIAFAGVYDVTDYNDLPRREEIKSSFTMTPNSISMLGKSIDMTGQVTFNSLDSGAQSSINNAQVTASQAQSAANAASAAADAAQTTANVANSAAVGAQGSANAAQNTANVANSAAVGAQSSANAAQNTANIANAAANAAQGAANSANSVIANWSWNNDVTVIDGGKIVANTIAGDRIIAGTLAADRIVNGSLTSQQINVTELLAQNVTASGTITATNLIVTGSSKIGGFIIEDDYLTSVPSGGVYTGKLTLKPKTLQWDAVTQEYIGGQFVIRSSDLNINKDGSILKISRYNNHTLNKGLEIDMGVNGTAINILSGAIIVDGNSGFTGKVPFNQNQNTRYLNITNGIITSITNN
ncbi:hypothetical protein ACR79T_10250 [Sphingobacterium spiritivorum]|uniref:hypothetical protein n=1 Tax=Sphingobacterium spiritivorum TaxID=258 RepID=UPI003DA44288